MGGLAPADPQAGDEVTGSAMFTDNALEVVRQPTASAVS